MKIYGKKLNGAKRNGRNGWVAGPLTQAPLGASVRVVRVEREDPLRLVRLSSLGLVPGTTLQLRQRWPALILGLGESVLALDGELGATIHVQRVPPRESPCTTSPDTTTR